MEAALLIVKHSREQTKMSNYGSAVQVSLDKLLNKTIVPDLFYQYALLLRRRHPYHHWDVCVNRGMLAHTVFFTLEKCYITP